MFAWNRCMFLKAACLAAAVLLCGHIAFGQTASEKPNVLFIAADDLNDWVGYLGGLPQARAPHVDALAKEAVTFEHAYCPAPICGPSRTTAEALRTHVPQVWRYVMGPRFKAFIESFAEPPQPGRTHGLIGLRPLPRDEGDHKRTHGGSWAGTPTYAEQKGNYPFVAEHLDTEMGWQGGDFKTKQVFFEYYWGLSDERDDLTPKRNDLVRVIRNWEQQGAEVGHILIAREYDLAINRGHDDAKPGPFKEDTRILYERDVDNIRTMFKQAHEQGLLKRDNYQLIQMVQHPSFFADDERVKPIIDKMEGVCLEVHQFGRHWPLETGWVKPELVVRGAKWTLAQGKEYVFYFGPIVWKSEYYHPFVERDWIKRYWEEGLPKRHPKMHYYLNLFPHAHGRGRPVGPETDPHSTLGFTKWLIQEVKNIPDPADE